ncbi:uncharacterized protein NPIL_437791 [Nephila pilipes]|uniref:Uncharacterized protein n=1 Tax=Nephila pilipes TaxID=299642 RepID=A0A8X6NYF1_NEPPI|nr:uncharacterized protein NPIL_437791 [Nephila pilipes]
MSSFPSHQKSLQWRPVYPNPEIGVGSSLRVLPEIFFSGKENVSEFLDSIDSNASYFEISTNLVCAYLKGHLIRRAKDWFEVIGSSYVTGTAIDFAQLKQALTNSFLVVRNRSELEAEFYSSHQVRSQVPSDFVYKLLKLQKILNFEMTEENLLSHIIMRLSPQGRGIRVKLGEDLVGGNIEKLFEEARRNTKINQDKWAKYYNKRRREVDVKVKDLVLGQTHPMSSASKRIVSKFKPKFEGPYEGMKVEHNIVNIWKGGKLITVNVNQVRIYHPRERDEGVVETDGLDGEGSRVEQVETEGSKGLAREESSKEI